MRNIYIERKQKFEVVKSAGQLARGRTVDDDYTTTSSWLLQLRELVDAFISLGHNVH